MGHPVAYLTDITGRPLTDPTYEPPCNLTDLTERSVTDAPYEPPSSLTDRSYGPSCDRHTLRATL